MTPMNAHARDDHRDPGHTTRMPAATVVVAHARLVFTAAAVALTALCTAPFTAPITAPLTAQGAPPRVDADQPLRPATTALLPARPLPVGLDPVGRLMTQRAPEGKRKQAESARAATRGGATGRRSPSPVPAQATPAETSSDTAVRPARPAVPTPTVRPRRKGSS
jgi:hypothetical protein